MRNLNAKSEQRGFGGRVIDLRDRMPRRRKERTCPDCGGRLRVEHLDLGGLQARFRCQECGEDWRLEVIDRPDGPSGW